MSNTEGLPMQFQLFKAVLKEEWDALKDHADSRVTLSKDTGIHMAVHSGSKKPLEDLLANKDLLEQNNDFSTIKNDYGDTILHEAVIARNYEAVRLIVSYFPTLLVVRNNALETPLFKAAAYGWTKIACFLAEQPYYQITMNRDGNNLTEDEDGNALPEIHRQRPIDGTSILHSAVQGEHFDTAIQLLKSDMSLRDYEDKNGMTCLQLLANMPSAFKSGYRTGVLKSILYLCLPFYEDHYDEGYSRAFLAGSAWSIISFIRKLLILGLPMVKGIWETKRKHVFALKLAKWLIEKDMSWEHKHTTSTIDSSLYYSSVGEEEENDEKEKKTDEVLLKLAKLLELTCQPTSAIGQHQSQSPTSAQGKSEIQPSMSESPSGQDQSQIPTSAQGKGDIQPSMSVERKSENPSKTQNNTGTPLLLATRNGILEIVKEILKKYPQAVEHCSHRGQNILHVAVAHRQKEIFEHVKEMKIPMTRLLQRIDNNGYTILHHAAGRDTKGTSPGPALQLQAELKWFNRVLEHIPSHYARHVDKKGKTAEKLFKENHNDQLKQAQKWIKETSQSCSAVAVLIATVVFAAAYTVPGGPDNNGFPIFLDSPFFLFFTIMDVVSLASSLTSVVMFLSVLTSPFELQDFLHSLPRKLILAFTLLFFSVATTMLAFAATIVLTIRLNKKQWITILIYVSAFFPVTVFALMHFPLYIALFMSSLKDSFKKFKKVVSRNLVHPLNKVVYRNGLFCKKKSNKSIV